LIGDIDKKSIYIPHKLVEVSSKKFSARSNLKSPRKRGILVFGSQKTSFEKNAN